MNSTYFFCVLITVVAYAADRPQTAQSRIDFELLKLHINKCSLLCSKPCLTNAMSKIRNEYTQDMIRVYYTYHVLTELDKKQISDAKYRLFINYYGQMLACTDTAQYKSELILLHCTHSPLLKLKEPVPTLELTSLASVSERLYLPQLSYTIAEPSGELYVSGHHIAPMEKYSSFFYFFNLNTTIEHLSKHLLGTKGKYIDFSNHYRYFLLDEKYTVEKIYAQLDVHFQEDDRLVITLSDAAADNQLLLNINNTHHLFPYIWPRLYTPPSSPTFFPLAQLQQRYTIMKSDNQVGDSGFVCNHGIKGPKKEIEAFVAKANKISELRSSCLSSHHYPITLPERSYNGQNVDRRDILYHVYNNIFGEFIIVNQETNSKTLIKLNAKENDKSLHFPPNPDTLDLYDTHKLHTIADQQINKWIFTKSFIYSLHEAATILMSAKKKPFDGKLQWDQGGDSGEPPYRNYYYNPFIENIEPFKKYRLLLILPNMMQEEQFSMAVIYTDHPYSITEHSNNIDYTIFKLEHTSSAYSLYIAVSKSYNYSNDNFRYAYITFSKQYVPFPPKDYSLEPEPKNCMVQLQYIFKDAAVLDILLKKKEEKKRYDIIDTQ
jgi:hypothetical protein